MKKKLLNSSVVSCYRGCKFKHFIYLCFSSFASGVRNSSLVEVMREYDGVLVGENEKYTYFDKPNMTFKSQLDGISDGIN